MYFTFKVKFRVEIEFEHTIYDLVKYVTLTFNLDGNLSFQFIYQKKFINKRIQLHLTKIKRGNFVPSVYTII